MSYETAEAEERVPSTDTIKSWHSFSSRLKEPITRSKTALILSSRSALSASETCAGDSPFTPADRAEAALPKAPRPEQERQNDKNRQQKKINKKNEKCEKYKGGNLDRIRRKLNFISDYSSARVKNGI